MKEIMDEIRNKFNEEIQEYHSLENAAIIIIYDRIAAEVYLKKLSQMMDRN